MDAKGVLQLSRDHGYRNIPESTRVFLDAQAIDKEGEDVSRLLDLAAIIEFIEQSPKMFLSKKDQVELSDYDPHKGVCLSLYSSDVKEIEKFRSLCRVNLPKDLGWFHQCNTREYQMFEFWNPQTEAMRNIANKIANEMNLPLIVILKKEYRPGVTIEVEKFRPLYPDGYYEEGNFN